MKQQTSIRILVAAATALAPLAAAHANDFIPTAQAGYFQQAAAMPKSNADLMAMQGTHVRRNMLGWEIVTYDNPAAGPQGPVREEENPQANAARSAEESFWDRFYPIGGEGTP